MAEPPAAPRPTPTPIVRGVPRERFRDAYHAFLRMPWLASLGLIAAGFLAINVVFAGLYVAVGGIANARPGSFLAMLYFSVQTTAAIGYGAMFPVSHAANLLVVVESVISLVFTALATGLIFAKFSRPTARMAFTREAVITPIDGVPTLMFRVGYQRGSRVVDAQIRVVLSRTEVTAEGHRYYRMYDLVLARDRALALSRTWTVMHPIVAGSPLHGATPEVMAAWDAELGVSVVGIDDFSMQPVHAGHTYDYRDLRWGMRHADIIEETAEGGIIVDLTRFHDVVPSQPTAAFPYPTPPERR